MLTAAHPERSATRPEDVSKRPTFELLKFHMALSDSRCSMRAGVHSAARPACLPHHYKAAAAVCDRRPCSIPGLPRHI